MPVGVLFHDPYFHISKHSQQLAGPKLANCFVHSVKIHNKYDPHFDVIALYYFEVFSITIIARLGQDTNWQNHLVKRLHVLAFCTKHALVGVLPGVYIYFFASEQTQRCWYSQVKWDINEIIGNNIIHCKIIANSNISNIKRNNRLKGWPENDMKLGANLVKPVKIQ